VGADVIGTVLRHLEALVAFDTRNPPRAIGTGGIFDYLRAQLPDFRCTVTTTATVPCRCSPCAGHRRACSTCTWTPCRPRPRGPPIRCACASPAIARSAWAPATSRVRRAALVTAANLVQGDAAFLFSSDEEANDPRCIEAFLAASDHGSPKRSSPSPRSAKPCSRIAASVRC
jgi:acetylornithine deacetylase